MTKPLAAQIFDLIEAHQLRNEPITLAAVEAVVEQHSKPTKIELSNRRPWFHDEKKMEAMRDAQLRE